MASAIAKRAARGPLASMGAQSMGRFSTLRMATMVVAMIAVLMLSWLEPTASAFTTHHWPFVGKVVPSYGTKISAIFHHLFVAGSNPHPAQSLKEGLVELTRSCKASELFTAQVHGDSDTRIDLSSTMKHEPSDERGRKPLLAVVCGMGSGKTRLLEEIIIGILKDNGHRDKFIIALPLTFSKHWALTNAEISIACKSCEYVDEMAIHALSAASCRWSSTSS